MLDADMMTGALVRRTREERRMTQAELARRVGVTPAQISYLESGARPWSINMLTQVAAVLDVDCHALLPRIHVREPRGERRQAG